MVKVEGKPKGHKERLNIGDYTFYSESANKKGALGGNDKKRRK